MKQRRQAMTFIGLAIIAVLLLSHGVLIKANSGPAGISQSSAAGDPQAAETPTPKVRPNVKSSADETQNIALDAGWNMISSYIAATDPSMEAIFAAIQGNVNVVKNGAGQVYWPAQGINDIGDWNVHDGYQIFMSSPSTLSISGTKVDAGQTPISLVGGFNLIAYLLDQPQPIEQMLSGLGNQLYLAKDGEGLIYWPEFGVNQIGDLQPGEGYELFMNGLATLIYSDPNATATPTPDTDCTPAAGNILANPSFEMSTSDWNFYTNANGNFTTSEPGSHCNNAARIALNTTNNNMQLYQSGFMLYNGAGYRLSFDAYSNTGDDIKVFIQQQGSPYTNYGLSTQSLPLGNSWTSHVLDFTASGFSGGTTDTRLRFWFVGEAQNGDVYWIDNVVLEQTSDPPPTPTPSNTPAGQPTATNTPAGQPTATKTPSGQPTATNTPTSGGGGGGKELLVFDWNQPVTESHHGFPFNQPPIANGNWVTPVNYAQGTLYYRVEIFSQPTAQNMQLQFCFWQEKNGYNFELENCGPTKSVKGTPGTVATWSIPVGDMWKRNGNSIEWNRARFRNGAAIKNSKGLPVSNYNGWNWNGEDPKKWYPLNMRFTVVVVAKGSTFGGWGKYIN